MNNELTADQIDKKSLASDKKLTKFFLPKVFSFNVLSKLSPSFSAKSGKKISQNWIILLCILRSNKTRSSIIVLYILALPSTIIDRTSWNKLFMFSWRIFGIRRPRPRVLISLLSCSKKYLNVSGIL